MKNLSNIIGVKNILSLWIFSEWKKKVLIDTIFNLKRKINVSLTSITKRYYCEMLILAYFWIFRIFWNRYWRKEKVEQVNHIFYLLFTSVQLHLTRALSLLKGLYAKKNIIMEKNPVEVKKIISLRGSEPRPAVARASAIL